MSTEPDRYDLDSVLAHERRMRMQSLAGALGRYLEQRRGQVVIGSESPPEEPRYMPGLDGLRALAVFAVIFYHLGLPWARGGFNGVTLFFVLSGYLITDLLLTEWRRRGRIGLGNFWFRRAKRLLPAVFAVLICLTVYVAVFRRDMLGNLAGDLLPASFYYSNWWYIFHQISYFQSFDPQLLNHFWSLAVEEQFYIFWPLLLIAILTVFKKRKWLIVPAILTLVLASALAMALMYQPDHDPSRIYYGTDTRGFSLLVGAAVAYAVPSAKLVRVILTGLKRVLVEVVGVLALAGCVALMVFSDQYDDFVYRGGMLVFSVACAALILCAAHPGTWIGKAFSVMPLRGVGKISYGVYLWQWPVIILTDPEINVGGIDPLRCVLQVGLAVGLATASYLLIENPIRRAKTMRAVGDVVVKGRPPITIGLPAVLVAMGLGTSALFVYSNPPASAEPTGNAATVWRSPSAPDTPTVTPTPTVAPSTWQTPPPSTNPALNAKITMIGDSIAIDVAPVLKAHYPHIVVDGQVSRSFSVAYGIVSSYLAKGRLGDIVIIELGTNGPFRPDAMRKLCDLIGPDRLIVFVNVNVPRTWTATVNNTIATVAPEYPNLRVVDWHKASLGHREYFWKDAVHPTTAGAQVMVSLIVQAIGW